jgi:hypothetical protein
MHSAFKPFPTPTSKAETNGPGPRESSPDDVRTYRALWVARRGIVEEAGLPLEDEGEEERIRKAVLRCSYVNLVGANPTTIAS